MRTLALAIALVASAPPARAGETWATAVDREARPETIEAYDKAMARGDDAALRAAAGTTNSRKIVENVEQAVAAYEQAAKLRPKAAEPHYRAGNVLFGFYIDPCEIEKATQYCVDYRTEFKAFAKQARRVIAHWDEFEKLAPLDPRLQPGPRSSGPLFERAILRTKLATDDDLRAAIADYHALLERLPNMRTEAGAMISGNLAEAYMMVGELDPAVEQYHAALELGGGGDLGMTYGLAVAYDRDGQGGKAREMIRALKEGNFGAWAKKVEEHEYFYVPEGEEHYYYALAYEAFGYYDAARANWQAFIDSGAHPRFHARAHEHLAALKKRRGGARKR